MLARPWQLRLIEQLGPASPLGFADALDALGRSRSGGKPAMELAAALAGFALVAAGRALAGSGPAADAAAGDALGLAVLEGDKLGGGKGVHPLGQG